MTDESNKSAEKKESLESASYATYVTPGITVKLESKEDAYIYRLVMVLPNDIVICKSVDRPISEICEVGSIMNLVRPITNGSCIIPVKVTGIGDRAELIALTIIGNPQIVQRRVFPRIKADSGVQLKMQIDNHTSRYKSLQVYDLSGGGVGAIIYSKNPIEVGQFAKLDIQLPVLGNNRISARGQIVHCSTKKTSRFAYLIGVKFTEISEADQRKIFEYIAEIQKSQGKTDKDGLEFSDDETNESTPNLKIVS